MFADIKVSTRLALAFGVVLVMLVGTIALGISRMGQVNEGLRTITEQNNVEMNYAVGMRAAAFQVSVSVRNLMLMTEDAQRKKENETLQTALQGFDDKAQALEKTYAWYRRSRRPPRSNPQASSRSTAR